jgi:hypothetical protein
MIDLPSIAHEEQGNGLRCAKVEKKTSGNMKLVCHALVYACLMGNPQQRAPKTVGLLLRTVRYR